MPRRCDDCLYRFGCKRQERTNPRFRWAGCPASKKYVAKPSECFNSDKYVRNPRERSYVVLMRKHNGEIRALAYNGGSPSVWSPTIGMTWHNYYDAKEYLLQAKRPDDCYKPFIARVNTKACPIEVDFTTTAYKYEHGNVNFRPKDSVEQYYSRVLRKPMEE